PPQRPSSGRPVSAQRPFSAREGGRARQDSARPGKTRGESLSAVSRSVSLNMSQNTAMSPTPIRRSSSLYARPERQRERESAVAMAAK
ncbi:hypothetical protein KIPB_015795, partial [Kipferlia bialata]